MMQRVFVFLVVLVGLWAGTVLGQEGPDELIKTTTEHLFAAMKAQREQIKADPRYSAAIGEEILLPHVDFRQMARWVLGKYWRKATPEQQEDFIQEFRILLVRTYASTMSKYLDEILEFERNISILPLTLNADANKVVVRSKISPPEGGPPIEVSYRMYHPESEESWKIYDVTVEGISLATNYRSSFSEQIRRKGLNAFIEQLKEHNKRRWKLDSGNQK
jgi:phospholipid transport system substrate-binding protein